LNDVCRLISMSLSSSSICYSGGIETDKLSPRDADRVIEEIFWIIQGLLFSTFHVEGEAPCKNNNYLCHLGSMKDINHMLLLKENSLYMNYVAIVYAWACLGFLPYNRDNDDMLSELRE